MANTSGTLSNAEKVALLMVSLGKDSVEILAPYLTEDELRKVTLSINKMKEINISDASDIIEEFYHKLKEKSEKIAQPIPLNVNTEDVLNILENVEPKLLAEYLRKEPLLSIATMLSYLEPIRCAEILKEFPWEQQNALFLIFERLHQTDSSSKLHKMGTPNFLAGILLYYNQDARQTILEELSSQRPELYREIALALSEREQATGMMVPETGGEDEPGTNT